MRKLFKRLSSEESGVTIVEVIVSALLVVIISTFVFTALTSANRTGAQERYRAQAYAIAQEDQARLRSLQVSDVTRLNQTHTETQDGTTFTVVSTGAPKIDRTATSACDSGNSSADYIAISSTVTWPNMASHSPIVIESILTPPNGSLEADRGALGVSIVRQSQRPLLGDLGQRNRSRHLQWYHRQHRVRPIRRSRGGQLHGHRRTLEPRRPRRHCSHRRRPPASSPQASNTSEPAIRQGQRVHGRLQSDPDRHHGHGPCGDQQQRHSRLQLRQTQAKNFGAVGTFASTVKATLALPLRFAVRGLGRLLRREQSGLRCSTGVATPSRSARPLRPPPTSR